MALTELRRRAVRYYKDYTIRRAARGYDIFRASGDWLGWAATRSMAQALVEYDLKN